MDGLTSKYTHSPNLWILIIVILNISVTRSGSFVWQGHLDDARGCFCCCCAKVRKREGVFLHILLKCHEGLNIRPLVYKLMRLDPVSIALRLLACCYMTALSLYGWAATKTGEYGELGNHRMPKAASGRKYQYD